MTEPPAKRARDRVPYKTEGSFSTPGEISVFAREVVHRNKKDERTSLPYLVFFQGGPGFEAPRPMDCNGWIKQAVNYFRVVLLDQRGTGRSTPITCNNLSRWGSPEEQAQYLKFFRADSIVRDAEMIRKTLVTPRAQAWEGKWSVLGQSFGGFCAVTYLSLAPEGLIEVMMTGGVPPLIRSTMSADDVLTATYKRVITQNNKFYERFPVDVERVQRVVKHLLAQADQRVVTPAGNYLTPRSFQALGLGGLGFSLGFERLHYMLDTAFDGDQLSHRFMKEFDMWHHWDTNPIYAILHEAIYCQGGEASNWSAQRVRDTHYKEVFDAEAAVNSGARVMFTGEMVFPWLFEDFAELRKIREVAEVLAKSTDWVPLYKPDQLSSNTVPVAAATYFEDMFVDCDLAQETVASIKGMRQYVTSEYLHCGLREAGGTIFEKLLNMCRGGILLR
ncbi:hypothetical protein N2152v2_008708 [Parachlorella kessleri]